MTHKNHGLRKKIVATDTLDIVVNPVPQVPYLARSLSSPPVSARWVCSVGGGSGKQPLPDQNT